MTPEELEKRVESLEKRLRELEADSWMTRPMQPRCIPVDPTRISPQEVEFIKEACGLDVESPPCRISYPT